MNWRYYIHKPTEIRAAKWDGQLIAGMRPFEQAYIHQILSRPDREYMSNSTLPPKALIEAVHGFHGVWQGDYICRGDAGELYPLPAFIFEAGWELKPGNQPRQPITNDKMASDIQEHVQASIDRKGNPHA